MNKRYYRNTPEFIRQLHDVRLWLAAHPDSTRTEIEEATGHTGIIKALLNKDAIVAVKDGRKTLYRVRPMRDVGPAYQKWFEEHLPHPDKIEEPE